MNDTATDDSHRAPGGRPGWALFALSFTALFLELMVIRWVPSAVRLVAYYANLMLISSFLGLGIGALVARHRRSLFGWLPLLLLANVAFLTFARRVGLATTHDEARFWAEHARLWNYLILVGVFVLNTAVFVPLGQRIGALFHAMAPLRAYAWDLGGSLAGTVFFGLFSFYWFSPLAGMAGLCVVILLTFTTWSRRLWSLPPLALAMTLVAATDYGATWSPYHYITVRARDGSAVEEPASEARTMTDPPLYQVRVNQDFYQLHGTLDRRRYTPGYPGLAEILELNEQYLLPHALGPKRRRVAVLGAGGGLDAEAALIAGAETVDAVEIDPVLVDLSRRFSASGVLLDPRVSVVVDDARAFLRRAEPGYDLVVFGFLDSQILFSYMSNVRLDGFTYTVESFRTAFELLNDDGLLAISFAAGSDWLPRKLYAMVAEATGSEPIIYFRGYQVIICAGRRPGLEAPEVFGGFRRARPHQGIDPGIDLATDDWPYLYLRSRTVPFDYRLVIATLLVISVVVLLALRRRAFGAADAHFLFLGLGFLLLETKSIGDSSLYFGTTWFVTLVVVAGVLVMVLAANWLALRGARFSPTLYLPLFLSLAVLFLMPRQTVLAWPWSGRLLWTLTAVPLPIFFAGLIFSTTFRGAKVPSALFGANLIGAMIGGFCEYLAMAAGSAQLSWIVLAAYGASLLCQLAARRR